MLKHDVHLAPATQAGQHAAAGRGSARHCILVLGMHRSGTSAVTRTLHELGAAIPKQKNLLKPSSDNQEGFWESEEIVNTHNRFLVSVGSRWDDPRPLSAKVFDTNAAAHCRARLLEILDREFSGEPLFVVKDPRISNLMPMWRAVLEEFGARVSAVLVVRNPIEVALSLERRDGIASWHSLGSWLAHNLAAERHTRDVPRAFGSFDAFLADPLQTSRRLCKELDCFPAKDIEDNLKGVEAHWLSDMRHHQVGAHDELADAPGIIGETYRWLLEATVGLNPSAERLDKISEMLEHVVDLYAPAIKRGMPGLIRRGRLGALRRKIRRMRA